MIYLTNDDLTADSFQTFIDQSSGDIDNTIDKLELRAVDIVKAYLSQRFDMDAVFNEDSPIRNEVLVDIIAKIVLYKLFRRNAARKVPENVKEDNDWAMKQLEKINTGTISIGLPLQTDDSGNVVTETITGNLSNSDFYI